MPFNSTSTSGTGQHHENRVTSGRAPFGARSGRVRLRRTSPVFTSFVVALSSWVPWGNLTSQTARQGRPPARHPFGGGMATAARRIERLIQSGRIDGRTHGSVRLHGTT
jgi:hypothetical protein